MELRDTPQEAEFRRELREWLDSNLPGEAPAEVAAQRAWLVAWHRKLHGAGYTGLSWPTEAGGRGMGPIEEAIFMQECERSGVPSGLNYGFVGRAMLLFGSDEQRRRYLPGLLSGSVSWCQGFSEPNAGSDLAAIRTQAVLEEETRSYRVTGQKTWTSWAQFADLCLCLVRTGPLGSRHHGISALVVDMKEPGIEVRPIRSIRGDEEFCEVYFNEARVPLENLVGEPGQGWNYAMVTLTYERGPVDIGFVAKYHSMLERLWPHATTQQARRDLAKSAVAIEVLRLHTLRSLSARLDYPPGPEGSVDKLLMAATEQNLARTAMDLVGPSALVDDGDDWFADYLYSRAATIYGGTAQIQRNIIAEHCLGLER
jgi:alkylation response protein AidB-like acyl-CoA dehydrogenase